MNVPAIVGDILFYSFSAVIAIQVFYYLFFFSRLAFYKQPEKKQSIQHPISVVICAKNEAHNLAASLGSVLVQDYKTTHEVVLVNDNSEDETRYIAEEFQKTFKHLTIIDLVQEAKLIAGKKFPLSMGIRSSKYETILLTDADCIPASEFWMQYMQDAYIDDKEIILGYGAYHKSSGVLNKLIRWETFHSALQYLSYALAKQAYMGVGRNLSYKKDVFIRNKGFASINHLPSGDDDLFISKVATKNNVGICIAPEAHTLSTPKTTFSAWFNQKKRHYTTSNFYKPKHKFLLGLYSFSHFLVYPLLALSIFFYSFWWLPLVVFGVRFFIQLLVVAKTTSKLNEKDLLSWFWLLDIWMFFYYIIFSSTLFKKAKNVWSL